LILEGTIMKHHRLVVTVVGALLLAGGLFFAEAQAPTPKPAGGDPRIDKLVEQNQQILQNQQDIIKALADIREGLLQLRRRSS
jgi:hypothetical protein